MIPDRLWLHPEIKDFDLRLWCCLWFLARDRGHCFETDATIAEKMCVSVKTVQRGLRNLEQGEFLSRDMVGRERRLDLRPEGGGQPLAEFALRLA
jgi:CTP-dependent riboflavin kinase